MSGLRLFRFLLRMFPSDFRLEHQQHMLSMFRGMLIDRAPGWRATISFWFHVIIDLGGQAFREHIAPSSGPPRLVYSRKQPMSVLLQDLKQAVLNVRRQPVYAAMVITMMALGIAGNAAVFRVFNGLFLHPLPFDNAHELVDLDEEAPQWNLQYTGVSYVDFAAWREHNETFQSMAVYSSQSVNFAAPDDAERIDALQASHDLLEVLRIPLSIGRFFTEAEDTPDGPQVTVISSAFWTEAFGQDPSVIGSTIQLNNRAYEIIGVLDPQAALIADAQVWTPLQENPNGTSGWYLTGVGRLKPGTTREQAVADLTRIHKGRIEERAVNDITAPVAASLRERYLGNYRLGTGTLLGAMALVLAIACANIAALMLARSLSREREIGIRTALGATTGRITSQLLSEGFVLALVGATLGTGLGVWGSAILTGQMSDQFPNFVRFPLDMKFFGFSLALTGIAGVAFGLFPASASARGNHHGLLHATSNRSTSSLKKRRVMHALVAAEVTLSLVLLIVAGLQIQDLRSLHHTDPGFNPNNLLSYSVSLPSAVYPNTERRVAFFNAHIESVRSLPGVLSAAGATLLPFRGHSGTFFQVEGAPERADDDPNPVVLTIGVTHGYVETVGMILQAGRPFNEFDGRDDASSSAIINETFARTFFGEGEDPIGKRINTGGTSRWRTIVGITQDVKHYGVDEDMRPSVLLPLSEWSRGSISIAVRAAGDPLALTSSIREALRTADPNVPVSSVETLQQRLRDSLWPRRASSWVIGVFSTVALILAIGGIYGVISYSVGQRRREISIRLALGAKGSQVLAQIVRQGMGLVAIGLTLGLVTAWASARVVTNLLVGVSATDPRVYIGVTVLLAGVAAIANWFPARRAARTAPMQSLRED